MLEFTATKEQADELEGLGYMVAEKYRIIERYGVDDVDAARMHENILYLFSRLDALCVPFWVQNSVVAWGENWRNSRRGYLWQAMAKKNIFLNSAANVAAGG